MSTCALAAVLTKPGEPLQIGDVLLDDPRADEVLVRTDYVGLCHSDRHYLTGSLAIEVPAVLGHEVVGTVTGVGPTVTRFSEGDRVVVGAVLHGAGVSAADTVTVIGCGGVGIAAIQGARLAGARRIVAVDSSVEKRPPALRFGATDFVLADRDPTTTAARLRELVPAGFTQALEAVGRRETAELAFTVLAPTGKATILGLMPAGERLSISADALVYGDRVLQGAYMGANQFLSDVELFTDHYHAGRLDLDGMVTTLLPFAQINAGFEAMTEPTTIRVVLDVSGGQP